MKNKISNLAPTLLMAFFLTLLISCSKDDNNDNGGNNSRQVKYELTGTYSGTLLIVYINEDGVNQLADNVSLPWSKEVTIKGNNATTLILNANSEVGGFGQANQTITGKILVGGVEKKTATTNSTSTGYIDVNVFTAL